MGGMASSFSGSSARKSQMATAAAQQVELDKQKELADTQQTIALQDGLSRDTNRLLRVFGTRSLLSGSGLKAPMAA